MPATNSNLAYSSCYGCSLHFGACCGRYCVVVLGVPHSYDNSTIYLTIKEHNKKVQISVRDTGQGIAPQYKDKIFDRYFRVPGTKKEGTGIGLAISKEFIEAQGGQINVESEFGIGSTFTLTLNTS